QIACDFRVERRSSPGTHVAEKLDVADGGASRRRDDLDAWSTLRNQRLRFPYRAQFLMSGKVEVKDRRTCSNECQDAERIKFGRVRVLRTSHEQGLLSMRRQLRRQNADQGYGAAAACGAASCRKSEPGTASRMSRSRVRRSPRGQAARSARPPPQARAPS